MGFIKKQDSLGALTYNAGIITLQPSFITIGGQQYSTSILTYTVTGLTANTKYNLFAVVVGVTVSLVASTNSITLGPSGYTKFYFIRAFATNSSGTFGSFAGTMADPFPVGTIIDSLLTEAQFQALMGTGWILMDSRSVSSTMYANLTGASTMTDARGQFRRSKNNGRADGNQDPGGERALGNLQAGAMQSHNHFSFTNTYTSQNGGRTSDLTTGNYPSWGNGVSGAGEAYNIMASGNASNVGLTSAAGSGNETRPRNIAVNTFVKINME